MPKSNGIVAIVQARMGSTRLPGKVLMRISGEPILWHVVERLKKSELIDKIVIATTITRDDLAIVKFCQENNITYFRGFEEDVLDRYYQAAKVNRAAIIVRITADCPLIDPDVVDKTIRYYMDSKGKFDYVSNILKRTFPRGLDTEVFGFEVLRKVWKEAKKGYEREHVTVYIYEHPKIFWLGNLENKNNLSGMRWTVDERKDFEFVNEIYKRLYKRRNIFYMNDVVRLLEKEPSL